MECAGGGLRSIILSLRHSAERSRDPRDRFEEFVVGIDGVVWEADARTFQFTFVSPQAERMFGYPSEQWLERDFWVTHLHPEDRAAAVELCLEATRAGRNHTFEYRMIAADGRVVWVRDIVTVRVEDGEPATLRGVLVDVSDRRQAETALRETVDRLRLATHAANIGLWDWDLRNNQVVFSREWKSQLGYAEDEVRGDYLEWESRLHPDDFEPSMAALRGYLAGDTSEYSVEFRMRHKDGSWRWIHAKGDVLRNDDGAPIRMLGCHLDITERKQSEQAMVERDNLLNAVIEGTDDAVFVKDLEGRYLMVNSAAARNLGHPPKDVIGRDDASLWTRTDVVAAIEEQDRDVVATGRSRTFEMDLISRDGTPRTLHTRKSAFRDASGRVIGLIGIARDISERKHLEEQFRQAQKMEAVGRLAGGVAHDFNNLLTVIHGFTQLVFDRLPPGGENRESLAEVIKAAERATNLTKQLLVFSRKQPLRPRTVDVNALVGDLLRLLRRLIGEDIEFGLTLHAASPFTEVDPGQFEQAIINLAVNARDAMPDGGRLVIETREAEVVARPSNPDVRAGRYVRITVHDTGVGMDDATQARVFEPFFTTKGPGQGTGLGLAMVYGFVRQSGGFIDVNSTPGAGTTFDIYLPVATRAPSATENGEGEPEWMPTGSETILIVEDESAVRSFARGVLESSGYTVLVASDGEEGLKRAAAYEGPIDLLVTDLVMPRLGGRQLAETLRRSRPHVKLLFMSGYTEQPVPSGTGGTNAPLLQKPFVALELVRKVRRVLDAPAATL